MIIEASAKRRPDDNIRQLPTAAKKAEQVEPSWRAGFDAAYAAKMAGKPTPRAPQGVDGVSYASGAVDGAAAGEQPDAREVLTELFTEELIPHPDLMADLVIARLGSRGFLIYERPKPSSKP